MKHYIFYTSFAILLISSKLCQAQATLLIKNKNYEGVTFNEKSSYPFFSKKKRFIPDLKEIVTMEEKLRLSIKKLVSLYKGYVSAECKIVKHLSIYKRQYFGYFENGEKIIFTSFIFTKSNDWKRNIVFAEGGGCNFFKLKYASNKKTFYDLSINTPE